MLQFLYGVRPKINSYFLVLRDLRLETSKRLPILTGEYADKDALCR